MSLPFHHLKNHICRDPISDWFEMRGGFMRDELSEFHKELMIQKTNYISDFVNHFRYKHSSVFSNDLNHAQTTKLLTDKKECILYNCELYNHKVSVRPTLIFSRNVFREIFSEVTIDLPEYIAIDILYTILTLNADKTNLLNQGSLYYHKCKMWLVSDSLSPYVTGITKGYFFGKEYRHKEKTLIKRETIGVFQLDDCYKFSIKSALEWLKKLARYGTEWVTEPTPSVKELYPNMNHKHSVWETEKTRLADRIQEITLVWNISYEKRCSLVEKGITKWSDPILLSQIYQYHAKDTKRRMIQEKMIHMNSQTELKISPRRLKNPEFIKILKDQTDSIILDIESTNNLKETESYFKELPLIEKPRICIIGTIINQGEYIFKDFTIRYLTNNEEEKVIKYWANFLRKKFKNKKIKVYHWGQAEETYLKYMKITYPHIDYPEFIMINLLNYFREEPITIQGCFGYGLKDVVKQLYNLQLIETTWEDDISGLDAMTQIMKTSEQALLKNIPLKRFTEIKRMITYNYYDCRVIVDLLQLLTEMI